MRHNNCVIAARESHSAPLQFLSELDFLDLFQIFLKLTWYNDSERRHDLPRVVSMLHWWHREQQIKERNTRITPPWWPWQLTTWADDNPLVLSHSITHFTNLNWKCSRVLIARIIAFLRFDVEMKSKVSLIVNIPNYRDGFYRSFIDLLLATIASRDASLTCCCQHCLLE